MRKFLLPVLFLVQFIHQGFSQVSFGNFAGNDTSILCAQKCLGFRIQVPDIRSTDEYKVESIPYQPYPYVTSAPEIDIPCTNKDDEFSDVINPGFPFSFYGHAYNSFVIGTNGVISFDVSNALKVNFWNLKFGYAGPIPFSGTGVPNTELCPEGWPTELGALYPRASIMGVYHDMDISGTASPSSPKKMEYRIEGTAPYRRAVISFHSIPLFFCNVYATHQMVIYESFNYIDVYIQDKPQCPDAPNGGKAILGIQNWERDKAVAVPGRNWTDWGTNDMNEGWRFYPDGNASLLNRVELLLDGNIVSTGVVGALSNGSFPVDFSNVCPPAFTNNYKVRAYYKTGPTSEYFIEDSLVISLTGGFTASAVVTNALCSAGGNGTITVSPAGAQYEYSIDGGVNWQSNNVFTAGVGNYTISVISNSTGCSAATGAEIVPGSPIIPGGAKTDITCNGLSDGGITVTPSGSTGPFTYSIDGGANFQSNNVFSNLAASSYTITIKDGGGCTKDTSFIVTEPPPITATASGSPSTCSGNDGSISITVNGGVSPFKYAVDGTNFVSASPVAVGGGNYNNIRVMDNNGCTVSANPVTIDLIDTMRLTLGGDTTVCAGNGIVLNPQTNTQTTVYEWAPAEGLNNARIKNPIASPGAPVTYALTARWGQCERTASVTINILKKPVAHAGRDTAICRNTNAGIHGSASNLSGPVNYSWSPAETVFPANTPDATASPNRTQAYTLTVTDNYGCNFRVTDDVLVTVQPPVPAFAGTDSTAVIGEPHRLAASGGVSYQWEPANILDDPTSRTPVTTLNADTRFKVYVTDAAGCIGMDEVNIRVYRGPDYYIGNAFTPNGDGLNDVFRPVPVGIVNTTYFRIYNRFGQIVFESGKFMEGWNGRFKGELQPSGTYVWILKGIDNKRKIVEKKGTVALIR